MDELNKQQIVLLTLLVSIVTSIATGITTISLIGQNPVQTVTQTVNRVVEKTIERVVETPEEKEQKKQPVEKEIVTIVVNEEDLTIEAIENNSKSIARVFDSKSGNFISIGVVIKEDGTIYVPAFAYDKRVRYTGEYKDGTYPLELVAREDANDLMVMKPIITEEINFDVVQIGDTESLKLGQSVISLSGINSDTVATGIITEIIQKQEGGVRSVDTSVRLNNIARGSVLLNLQGKVIGIKSGIEATATSFSPSSLIFKYLGDSAETNEEEVA